MSAPAPEAEQHFGFPQPEVFFRVRPSFESDLKRV
jgi:hypothetical protein